MRILLTNDDGIDAPGIGALARSLDAAGHHVVVVAPEHDMSGMSAALRPGSGSLDVRGIDVTRHDLGPIEGWCVPGPPGLCAFAAGQGSFGALPDLVVSGVNAGLNTGQSLLHSGTVGAALTAATFAIPALAVSIQAGRSPHWDTACGLAGLALDWLNEHRVPGSVFNLNVPDRPLPEVRGFRWAPLDRFGAVQAASDDPTRGLAFELRSADRPPDPGSDLDLVEAGYATATIVRSIVALDPTEAELAPLADPGSVVATPQA